jgi:Skp family chaperone for outer membrane proteins
MTKILQPLAAASVALAAIAATPVAAQVNGMATSSPEAVLVRSAARGAAYQQIDQTYAAQITQARTVRQEINTLQQSLDTNRDNNLTEQEVAANPGVVQQIQQKEQQIGQISQPIALAQYYVIEQLINDYQNAQNQVIQAKRIQVLISPDAIQYAPDNFNVTDDILAALDQRLPTVTATPPAGWQPRRDTVQTHQAIQQILLAAAQQQALRQQQTQQPAQTPQGR